MAKLRHQINDLRCTSPQLSLLGPHDQERLIAVSDLDVVLDLVVLGHRDLLLSEGEREVGILVEVNVLNLVSPVVVSGSARDHDYSMLKASLNK